MSIAHLLTRFKPTNPIIQRFFYGAKWSLVGAILSRALALVLSILVARLLGAELFGQFLIIQSTLMMFGVFAGLGLGGVATKFAAELRQRDVERLGRILELIQLTAILGSVIIAATCALLAPIIAEGIKGSPELTTHVQIVSISIVFLTWDGYNTATLFGLEYIKQSIQSTVFAALLSVPIAAFLTWQFGLFGAVYGILVSSVLQSCASFIAVRKALAESNIVYRRHTRAEWSILFVYAVPSLIAGAMVGPIHWLCQAILARTENGLIEVAVLGIGLQWFQLIFFLPVALSRVVLPIVTDIIANRSIETSARVLRTSMLANAAVSIPLAFAASLLSEPIMGLYGVGLPNAALTLTLIVVAASISAVCAPLGQLMVAKGQVWYGLMMNLGWAFVYLGLSWVLISWGALGVASALITAYIAHSFWVCFWVWKKLN